MTQIITLTMNPALDKSASVSNVIPEHKMRCGEPSWQPGGGGINVARVAHRLGAKPVAIFPLGGHTGELFMHLLAAEGIEMLPIPIGGAMRESLAIYEEATGQQYRFNFAGPELTASETASCINAVADALEVNSLLVLSGSLPLGLPSDFYKRLIESARQCGARVIVDSSGEALQSALEAGVYLIKPNLRELDIFAGRVLERAAEREAFVSELVNSGCCQAVAVSLGAAGVMLATQQGIDYIRAPIVPIRSKVGAGDSMVGGLVWSLAQGHALPDAVRYGVAAGAACVMTPGTELAYRDDVHRLVEIVKQRG